MQELIIEKMENVYGIKKMRLNIDGGRSKSLFQSVIYSKNGVFKTSFSNCLYELSNGNKENIKDRITNEPANINIKINNDGKIEKNLENKFIVFSREIYERNHKKLSNYEKELRLLTMSEKDKKYVEDLVNGDTDEPLLKLEEAAKRIGLNYEKTIELLENKDKGLLDNIIDIFKSIQEAPTMKITQINFKKIFQRTYGFIDDEDFKVKVGNYIEIVNKRVKEDLFDDKFDESNCLSFLDTLKKDGYLSKEKHRGLIIQGKEYYDFETIEKFFKDTIDKIIKEPEVLEKNKELLKTIGTTAEAENIKKDIVNNPRLVNELSLGRKNIILAALKNLEIDTKYWIERLEKTKKELMKVYEKAKDQESTFDKAIKIYTDRFHPVFTVEVDNKQESMLGLEMPYIKFTHNSQPNHKLDEDTIYDILSSGEKTTLNIIKFIVEYISNKNNPIIVLDDIVETFDYSNRYAFIEYINDITKENIPIIVLTHNFEFYKTLCLRVNKLKRLAVSKTTDGTVSINSYNDISINMERILNISNDKGLLFAIPYIREAKMILQEDTSLLTSCLHYKAKTKHIKIKEILEFCHKEDVECINKEELYLDALKRVADRIRVVEQYDLASKTILSISCRVFLEAKIIEPNISIIEDIHDNQFKRLKELYKDDLNEEVINLMEKVELTTPEFIHGNSFMYEPLVDIDGSKLKELYKDVKDLNPKKIWKHKPVKKVTKKDVNIPA